MMGNLSPVCFVIIIGIKIYEIRDFHFLFQDLKNHAVTMFEVGKLCDESIDSFLEELDKVFRFNSFRRVLIKNQHFA